MKKIILLVCCFVSLAMYSQTDGVGINTTEPKSTLDINGNLSVKHITLTGSGTPTLISDGVYISINPTANDQDFELPDPREFPGRIYVIRNVNDTLDADVTMDATTISDGVLFFAGDSSTGFSGPVNMDTNVGGGHRNKTLIFISDGSNWTYGHLGF
ncbi:hypothetical protein [Winogradskyella sp.]|uniref:hypothetical protein n=1 Tax=Winogradskyella sp. TaxID=1883156 RepID=UPI003516BF6E